MKRAIPAAWVLGLVPFVLAGDEPAAAKKRIAVVPILNTSGDAALDRVAEQAADLLAAGLAGKAGVEVLERRRVTALIEELDFGKTALVSDPAAGRRLGERAEATHLVLGSVYSVPGGLRLTLRLVKVATFAVERSAVWTGAATQLDEKVGDRLARELLGLPLPEPENVRKARQLIERGEFLLEMAMHKEAIEALEKAADLTPNDARLHVLLARCYLALRGRRETALKEAQKAAQLDPTLAEAWALIARIHLLDEKPDKAVAPVQAAIRLAPGSAALHSLLARIEFERKQFDEGIEAAERAIELDARWADGHNVLGHCRAEQGDLAKAQASLERATALAPSDGMFAGDLALCYEAAGALEKAVTEWERALTLVPPKSERADWIRRHVAGLKERLAPPDDD